MKCPHCSKEHPDDFKVCPYTAQPIETQSLCCKNKDCDFRSPLPLTAKFCPNCGQSLVNTHQYIPTDCRFDDIGSFHSGYAVVKKGSLYGLISITGELQLECKYRHILPFSEGLCGVCESQSDDWFFLDSNFNQVLSVPSKYYVASYKGFSCGLCSVFISDDESDEEDTFGYIDVQGNEAIPCTFQYCGDFVDGHAVVVTNYGSYFVIDKMGHKKSNGWDQIDIRRTYAVCNDFNTRDNTTLLNLINGDEIDLGEDLSVHVIGNLDNNICCYKKKDKLVWFNLASPFNRKSFKQAVKTCWGDFNEGLMAVQLKSNHLFGFIDTNGEVIIPFRYDVARNFVDGLAAVCLEKKWGFIDSAGKLIIKNEYEKVADFSEGLATVLLNGKAFVINKDGKIVIK